MWLSLSRILVLSMATPTVLSCSLVAEAGPPLVTRAEWGAREPKERENMTTPVSTVVVHHTYEPGACHDREQCVRDMRQMQDFHMDDRGWNDIGYTFVVGGDSVYEGRGWHTVGAHAPRYNNRSVGISFIGDYTKSLPTELMLQMGKELIQYGVVNNFITADYQLVGHRQVRDTECPGDAFYQLIETWDHWTPNPV